MPRQSASAMQTPAIVSIAPVARLKPPPTLTPDERKHWNGIVCAMPPDYFRLEHVPALVSLCRHLALADKLSVALGEVDPMADLERFGKLSSALVSHSKSALAFERSLRLTIQAQRDPGTAGNAAKRRGEASFETLARNYGIDYGTN